MPGARRGSRETSPLCQPASVEIVDADPAQATALRDLHLTAWEVTYRDRAAEGWYSEGLAAHADRDWVEIVRSQAASGGGVLSAISDGSIIGLCQYGPTEDPDQDPGHVGQIHRLYVHPARQRAGVGRSLLAAAVTRLRESGANTATLWVLESDLRARSFYKRLGWKPDGARKIQPPTDLRYQLRIRQAAAHDVRAGETAGAG
jgi:ribosomal protein S18 acetylase RimI-like enzyme